MDYFQNHIKRCIISHKDKAPLEILTLCTRCKKGFIAYYNIHEKSYNDSNHFALLKNLSKDANIALRSSLA